MANRIPTSSPVNSVHPDFVDPTSTSGVDKNESSLSLISDVQSAVAQIEQRLAQSPSQSSTPFSSSSNPSISASSTTLAAVFASPANSSSQVTSSGHAHTSAPILVPEKVELFERCDPLAMPKPSTSHNAVFTTLAPSMPLASTSSDARQRVQHSQSTRETKSTSISAMSTLPIEAKIDTKSQQPTAVPAASPSSIAAVIERFENAVESDISSQGRIRLDSKPIASTVQRFEAEIIRAVPRNDLPHLDDAPTVPTVDQFEVSELSQISAIPVIQKQGTPISDSAYRFETSRSQNTRRSKSVDYASAPIVSVVKKFESQMEVNASTTGKIHCTQVQVAASVEQSELTREGDEVPISSTIHSTIPASSTTDKGDNRLETIGRNRPVECESKAPPIVPSVDSREDNSQSKRSSLQRNSSNPLTSDTNEISATVSHQTVPCSVPVHVQTTPEINNFAQKDALEPVKNHSLTANKNEDVEKSTDPSSEAEQLVAEHDTPASLKLQSETLAESRDSADGVATECNVVADQMQFEESDKHELSSSVMTAEQDNNQTDLLSSTEGEYVVPIVSVTLTNEKAQPELADEMKRTLRMHHSVKIDTEGDCLDDHTQSTQEGDSELVEATSSGAARTTFPDSEQVYEGEYGVLVVTVTATNENEQPEIADEEKCAPYVHRDVEMDIEDNCLNGQAQFMQEGGSKLMEATGSGATIITIPGNERVHELTLNTPASPDLSQKIESVAVDSTLITEQAEARDANAVVQLNKAGLPPITFPTEQSQHHCGMPLIEKPVYSSEYGKDSRSGFPEKADTALAGVSYASEVTGEDIVENIKDEGAVAVIQVKETTPNQSIPVCITSEAKDVNSSEARPRFSDVLAEADSLVAGDFIEDFTTFETEIADFSGSEIPVFSKLSMDGHTTKSGMSFEEARLLVALNAEIARQEKVEGVSDATSADALAEPEIQEMRSTTQLAVGNEADRSMKNAAVAILEENATNREITQKGIFAFPIRETVVEKSIKILSHTAVGSQGEIQASRQEGVQPQKTLNGTNENSLAFMSSGKVESDMTSVGSKPVLWLGSEPSQTKPSKRVVQTTNKSEEYVHAEAQSSSLNVDVKADETQIEQDYVEAKGFASTVTEQEDNAVQVSHLETSGNELIMSMESTITQEASKADVLPQACTPVRRNQEVMGSPMTPETEECWKSTVDEKGGQSAKSVDISRSTSTGQMSQNIGQQRASITGSPTVFPKTARSSRKLRPGSSPGFRRGDSISVDSIANRPGRGPMSNPDGRGSRPDNSIHYSGSRSVRTPGSTGQIRRAMSMLPNERPPVSDRAAPRLPRVAELSGKEGKDKKVARPRLVRGSTFAGTAPRVRGTPKVPSATRRPLVDLSTSSGTSPIRSLSPRLSSRGSPGGDDYATPDGRRLRRTLSFSHPRRTTMSPSHASQSPSSRGPFNNSLVRTRLAESLDSPGGGRLERRATVSMALVPTSRLSRSFTRHKPTVPQPFDLVGLILHERTQRMIEEARRRADENDRRRRAFKPRPMPDFSNPFPKPKK